MENTFLNNERNRTIVKNAFKSTEPKLKKIAEYHAIIEERIAKIKESAMYKKLIELEDDVNMLDSYTFNKTGFHSWELVHRVETPKVKKDVNGNPVLDEEGNEVYITDEKGNVACAVTFAMTYGEDTNYLPSIPTDNVTDIEKRPAPACDNDIIL